MEWSGGNFIGLEPSAHLDGLAGLGWRDALASWNAEVSGLMGALLGSLCPLVFF
jgi:hypothetical protein